MVCHFYRGRINEGSRQWTADLHLKDRIEFTDQVEKYIPDFTYHVVSVNQYTNEELSRKRDEMSLVMLINKIQTPEDYEAFTKVSGEMIDSIYGKAPEEIKRIYREILWSLLIKMNVPGEEARELMGEIGGRGMGILFEHMEKMDIQAERRNTEREKVRADSANLKAAEAINRADKAEKENRQLRLEIQKMKQEMENLKQKNGN